MKEQLTYEQVAHYIEHRDGKLFCRASRRGRRVEVGEQLGGIDSRGYQRLFLLGRNYPVHRIVWLLVRGEWPLGHLDHINGDKADNRIENLRLCTLSQNAANRRSSAKRDLPIGVSRHWKGRYMAVCAREYLGMFADPESAGKAYDAAASRKYGEFATLNFGSQS